MNLIFNLSPPPPFSALDPANFYESEKGLNASCAKFVQVLHTSKMLGSKKRLGHSDFYANKNQLKQPGCYLDTCSHTRATELYYASCFQEFVFIGDSCDEIVDRSRFGLYNDGKSGCYFFDTEPCFGYVRPSYGYYPYDNFK